MLTRPALLVLPPLVALALAGCATAVPRDSSDGASGAGAGVSCDGGTTGGWELFTDPRLTISPDLEVVPLAEAGDSIEFADSGYADGVTYGYDLAYVDGGQAFANGGAFFDTEDGTFRLDGPVAPMGVDGGPYAGILSITATDASSTTVLGNVCVALAVAE